MKSTGIRGIANCKAHKLGWLINQKRAQGEYHELGWIVTNINDQALGLTCSADVVWSKNPIALKTQGDCPLVRIALCQRYEVM